MPGPMEGVKVVEIGVWIAGLVYFPVREARFGTEPGLKQPGFRPGR